MRYHDGCIRDVHWCDCFRCTSGVPEIPERPTIRERTRGVEVKWNSVSTGDSGPILYIVDFRWNVGPHQNEADMTPWQQTAQVKLMLHFVRIAALTYKRRQRPQTVRLLL
jgi:hypothetical protein